MADHDIICVEVCNIFQQPGLGTIAALVAANKDHAGGHCSSPYLCFAVL